MSARGNDIVIIDDGSGGSSKNGKKTQTTTSTLATTQTWQTKPTAQARGNQHVVQVNDGGGYGSATTQSTQPFRNPLAPGGPNPNAAAQRLNDNQTLSKSVQCELGRGGFCQASAIGHANLRGKYAAREA